MKSSSPNSVRCLELYSGIGGFAVVAKRLGWEVVRAIDINELAARVYRANFDHTLEVRTIESLPCADIEILDADLWWMSPPCQPFTRRGEQRDTSDTRSESFLHVLQLLGQSKPPMLAMENVPDFAGSTAANELRRVLEANGYRWLEFDLCSSDFGLPNRRRRYYLAASRNGQPVEPTSREVVTRPLKDYLDVEPVRELFVDTKELAGYESAIDWVQPDAAAITACFTSAYGKSPIRSGSWLFCGDRSRRFSPAEVVRLLGFPDDFVFPDDLTLRQKWKLVGNSLSIPSVDHVIRSLVR